MNDITIRQADSSDRDTIIGLLRELSEFAHSDGGFTLESVGEILDELTSRPEIYGNYLAETAGECVVSARWYSTRPSFTGAARR